MSTNGAPVAAPDAYLLHCAPEVRSTGNVGVSSDIFQVGMTLAQLLLGLNHLRAIWASVGRANYEDGIDAGRLLTAKDFPSHIPASVRRVVLKAVHPDPNQRYTSSLEMRRAIEKLNFPGHWSVDATGNEFGRDRSYEYAYEVTPATSGNFDVTCFRQGIASGKTQRITKFCRKALTSKQAEKAVSDFKCFVVTGR